MERSATPMMAASGSARMRKDTRSRGGSAGRGGGLRIPRAAASRALATARRRLPGFPAVPSDGPRHPLGIRPRPCHAGRSARFDAAHRLRRVPGSPDEQDDEAQHENERCDCRSGPQQTGRGGRLECVVRGGSLGRGVEVFSIDGGIQRAKIRTPLARQSGPDRGTLRPRVLGDQSTECAPDDKEYPKCSCAMLRARRRRFNGFGHVGFLHIKKFRTPPRGGPRLPCGRQSLAIACTRSVRNTVRAAPAAT